MIRTNHQIELKNTIQTLITHIRLLMSRIGKIKFSYILEKE